MSDTGFGGYSLVVDKDKREVINELKLWNVVKGQEGIALRGQPEPAFASTYAFSPDGKMLATGSSARTVKLWDVARLLE